jgi:NAD(P)-dependent dehydrogenase (short-subunit alcohol dehydrogenase family)
MTSLFDLAGQNALVTGSTRGIGKAIAEHLAQAGAKVVVSSRKTEACEVVVAGIEKSGGTAVGIPCNMSDMAQVEHLAREAERQLGPITILVCNAAVNPVYGPMNKVDARAFDKVMTTNVGSNIGLINLLTPQMRDAGGGSIIVLSSVVAFAGSRNIGAYAISKAADLQLVRNYAIELGLDNIRVNAIAPGLIKTDFATALWDGPGGQAFAARTPLGRLGAPDDIAGVALFLASRAAKFVTGQCIVADGGVLLQDPF